VILHVDYQTLNFMLDLPEDTGITGIESNGEGFVRFIIESAPDYGDGVVAPVYEPDGGGNVSLVGFTDRIDADVLDS